MGNLYEIARNFNNLENALEQMQELGETEETIELIRESLLIKGKELTEKVDNIVKYLRNTEANIIGLKNEEKYLIDKRKRLEKKNEYLKKYLLEYVSSTEKKEVRGDIFNIGVKNNTPKVVIKDESLISDDFKRVKTITEIDKAAIKDFIKKNNIEVPGAYLIKEESLKIK